MKLGELFVEIIMQVYGHPREEVEARAKVIRKLLPPSSLDDEEVPAEKEKELRQALTDMATQARNDPAFQALLSNVKEMEDKRIAGTN